MVFAIIFILAELKRIFGIDLVPGEYVSEFIKFLPGNLWINTLLLYLMPIGAFVLFYLLAPYFVVFYLKLHRILYTFRKKPVYGIVKLSDEVGVGKIFLRGFIPCLFSLTISALMVQFGFGPLLRTIGEDTQILNLAEAVFLGTFFFAFLTPLVFFPIYLMEDCGLISYRKFLDDRRAPHLEGTNVLFMNLLESFSGYSTIIVLIMYIWGTLEYYFTELEPGNPAVLTPFILILLPFIVIGLISIPVFLYEFKLDKLRETVREKIEKYNLPLIDLPDV